jgi:2-methylcitrate dehydratase
MRTHVTVALRDGRTVDRTQDDYEGYHTRPMSWETVEAKFDRLAASRTSGPQRQRIVQAIRSLDSIDVAELTEVLRAPS